MRDAKAIRRAKSAARAVCSPALIAVTLLAGLLLQDPSASAAPPIRFSGELGGLVTDVAGRPQTGAAVLLFNRQDRLLQRSATDSLGTFAFSDLLPDSYSVRVSLSSFVPAIKDRILIKPGMRSLLEVNLSRVFSSVQLVSTSPVPGGLMNDNWKWALRADSSVRPILRFLPVQRAANSPSDSSSSGVSAIFTDSRGLVKISASDGAHDVERWPGGPRDTVCFCDVPVRWQPFEDGGGCRICFRIQRAFGCHPDYIQQGICPQATNRRSP